MSDTTEPQRSVGEMARSEIDRLDTLIDRLLDPSFDPAVVAPLVERLSNAKLNYLTFVAGLY